MIQKISSDTGWKISITLLLILQHFSTCSTNNKLQSLKKENQLLRQRVDKIERPLNAKQTSDIIENVMFDFLIYEDDLDRGKTNLTNIKNKIEK